MGRCLTKFDDWDIRGAAALQRKAGTCFCYGDNDCSIFVADVILAMTGTDLAANARKKYKTKAELENFTKLSTGSAFFYKYIARLFKEYGLNEIHPKKAKRLMPVLISIIKDNDNIFILAIMNQNGDKALAMGKDGIVSYPVEYIIRAWEF